MAKRLPESFRFVDRKKTLAVAGEQALRHEAMVEKLRRENFHVISLVGHRQQDMNELKIPYTSFAGKSLSIFGMGPKEHFTEMLEEIETRHKQGKKVLIACGEGVSTGPTVAAAYLVLKKGHEFNRAVEAVSDEKYAQDIVRGYLKKFLAADPEYLKRIEFKRVSRSARVLAWLKGGWKWLRGQ